MSIAVRVVTLSSSADELLLELARRERMDPDVFSSLVLENAIRERHERDRAFAAAAAKVCGG